jgi:hypothetical protein
MDTAPAGPTREVKLLVDYRHNLVGQRTELINWLRRHLREIDPNLQFPRMVCAATASSMSWLAAAGRVRSSNVECRFVESSIVFTWLTNR